jgi:pimeloyl-ACP methyl ester carboxylesterase
MLDITDVVIDGVRCAVRDSDPKGRREAVVFVHGNPGPMDDWDDLFPEAAKFARAVAMDMPGYGRADHPRRFEYTVQGYARYLGKLLEHLGVEQAHLVLHDFGGGWGLGWAVEHPRNVKSVTLINTGVLRGYRWHKLARIWQTPVLGELFQLAVTPRAFKMGLDRANPKPMPQHFADRILRHADWGHRRAVLALYRATRDPDALVGPFVPVLRSLDLPACVVWGAEDPYLSVEYAERQKETFPRAEVHVLPGLGHWPFIDDPERVKAACIPFLCRSVTPQ